MIEVSRTNQLAEGYWDDGAVQYRINVHVHSADLESDCGI